MDLMLTTFFIFILFIFLICSVFIIRKRLIKKAMLLEIDEDLKNLEPKEFFLNILKRENDSDLSSSSLFWSEQEKRNKKNDIVWYYLN